jgi:CDP-6-deoxy-D-xylo-4-hexulose-3-dehydrase
MIPLKKSAFLNEVETKEALAQFILKAPRLSMGEQCARFEEEFAAFQGANEAALFNSGGSANLAMLQSLKNLGRLKDGDRVGDCEPITLNVMSWKLKKRLEDTEIQALFITNALGFAGDLDVIREICRERNIILIEDNCEALGTELVAGKTGSFGEMASFSFFVAHHMSTIEGGMVCTNDSELTEMLRIVRANGWDRNLKAAQQHKWRKKYNIHSEFDAKYTFYDLGYNFRPTEITGFLGRYQLKFLRDNIIVRETNHISLDEVVKQNPDLVTLDRAHISVLSSFAFPVLCRTPELKERYLAQFAGAGVEVRPMIAGNIQKQPFYRKYVPDSYELTGADKVDKCGFYCGNYPELTEDDLQILYSCLGEF